MRTTLLWLLVGVIALALGTPVKVDEFGHQYKVADKVFLEKQKDILRLFKFVFQPNYYEDQAKIAKEWEFEEHFDLFSHQKYVKEFYQYFQQGLLPRGEVFSIFNEVHRKQAVALFHVFYYAKDFETFYKVACWARQYVNEGMFIYSMHVAVFHRPDTEGFYLPPIYEINPYFFVHNDVIHQAHEYKMKYGGHPHNYRVPSNYSGWYLTTNPEQKDLGYFYEDVSLNALYFYYHVYYPFWMGGEEYGLHKDRRGELYYGFHEAILKKYYMERLSNGYGSVEVFDWHKPTYSSFESSLEYPNGMRFPSRPAQVDVNYNPYNQWYTRTTQDNVFQLQDFEDCERRIRDAIAYGFFYAEDGTKVQLYEKHSFDTFGKLMESSPDSPNKRCYCSLHLIARQVLGYAPYHHDDYKIAPSVLEHYETSFRDPMFFQMYKRIIHNFLKYKQHLPHYTYADLKYDGIKVESFHVDKMVTFFDKFEFDITNAISVNEEEFKKDDFHVTAYQSRLNHKQFSYKVQVQSDKPQKAIVRVFFSPKYDENGHEILMKDMSYNFVEFDKFVFPLNAGENVMVRNSKNFYGVIQDRTSYRDLYKKVMTALKGEEEFHLDRSQAFNGFPYRFVLPKGKIGGQVFQFYVFVSPYKPGYEKKTYDPVVSAGVGSGTRYIDEHPFGYPFDRHAHYWNTYMVPNAYRTEGVVYHKTEYEVNTHA